MSNTLDTDHDWLCFGLDLGLVISWQKSQDNGFIDLCKVSKGAKIRNRYNQVPHLTQDTNGKVINLQLDTTNESQEVSLFSVGDHKAHINSLILKFVFILTIFMKYISHHELL